MISPQSASVPSAELSSPPFWTIDEEIALALLGCSWGTQPSTKMKFQRLESLCKLGRVCGQTLLPFQFSQYVSEVMTALTFENSMQI